MSIPAQFDIVIAGGGMVGASLACALGDTGITVALVEAVAFDDATQPSFDERTVALTFSARRIFEALGVWSAIAPEAGTITRIHVSDRGRPGMARLDRELVGTEALGYVVPHRAVGRALLGRLAGFDNIRLICPARVDQAMIDDRVATLTLDSPEPPTRLDAKLVVVADGGRSALGKSLGLATDVQPYRQCALIAIVGVDIDPDGTAYERFTDSGPLALLPLPGRRYALVWTLYPERAAHLQALPAPAFLAAMQTAFGDRAGRFTQVGERRTYPLTLNRLRDPDRPRSVAVGNAAHTVHPVAGQGFNLGLRDVAWLAETLVEARAAGEDSGAPAVLARYAARRRRETRAVGLFTDTLLRIFTNESVPLAVLRNMGLAGIDLLPGVKRALLTRTMGLAGRQSRLALGRPLTGEQR